MKDQEKNKEELVNELMVMRQRIAELEASLVTLKQREEAGRPRKPLKPEPGVGWVSRMICGKCFNSFVKS